jgi:hypothetical protein
MESNGKCECGGFIVFESIQTGSNWQTWRCIDCNQIYFRNIFDLRIFKTLKELEAVNEQ